MLELMFVFEIILIIVLLIEMWLLHFWAKEHAVIMSIISHCLTEIKKKIKP